MEEKKISRLKRELKLKEFQFNSIFEFSESIYSSFDIESIIRIFFSTMMTQIGTSRIFLCDHENHIFKKRGFKNTEEEINAFRNSIQKLGEQWFVMRLDEIPAEAQELRTYLEDWKIYYLINISETQRKPSVLGLGARLNQKSMTTENLEYAYLVSKFSLKAIENAILINRLIETKRMEHEINIARDIQHSLLPQSAPILENFEVSVRYEPIHEVGGDYYDILKKRSELLPILIADVEGKGLPAALLAASSQAIFHSLNELYFFEPGKFMAKANAIICDFTRQQRFITVFWMLVDDARKSITYVNAGHIEPLLFSGNTITRLSTGGFLTGFMENAQYEKETIQLHSGDLLVAFTDGVPEVENKAGEEFGIDRIITLVENNRSLSAGELTAALFKATKDFSQGHKFRDDFTLIVLKVK